MGGATRTLMRLSLLLRFAATCCTRNTSLPRSPFWQPTPDSFTVCVISCPLRSSLVSKSTLLTNIKGRRTTLSYCLWCAAIYKGESASWTYQTVSALLFPVLKWVSIVSEIWTCSAPLSCGATSFTLWERKIKLVMLWRWVVRTIRINRSLHPAVMTSEVPLRVVAISPASFAWSVAMSAPVCATHTMQITRNTSAPRTARRCCVSWATNVHVAVTKNALNARYS